MTVDVWEAMGTVVSLRIPDTQAHSRGPAVEGVTRVIDSLEHEYSLYMDDSPISQLARGEVTLESMSADFRDTYSRAIEWRNDTAGAFTPHRGDGVIDLSGIVKADAIAAGAVVLRAHGITDFSLNFCGDIIVAGDDRTWPVAIGHPTDTFGIVATVELNSTWCAIATSGTGDRGEHIWRSVTSGPHIVGATVVSDDIVASDVWATSIISGGHDSATSASQRGYAVLYLDDKLTIHANPLMRDLISEDTMPLFASV
jgi:thiamine biosynthesis lipoprotein